MNVTHDAFISYSHEADGHLAPALESGLERLARPPFRLRAMDVFRDQTGLAAGTGVWSGILPHLVGARWLIYLASTKAAASPWCQKELRWWLEERGTARLLIVLTDGAIQWDYSAGDFDWDLTTVLPRADTQGKFSEVPLFVDLRWTRDVAELDAQNPRLRVACLDLAAPVRGVAKDQLDGDDVRELRRARNLRRAAVGVITLTAAVALWQAFEAHRQRLQAEDEREQAVSRQLAAQASEMRVREPVLALLLAAQAQATAPTTEAHSTLIRLARTMPLEGIVEDDHPFYQFAARTGESSIFASEGGGALWRFDLPTRQWSKLTEGSEAGIFPGPSGVAASPDGHNVAVADQTGTLRLWRDGAVVRTIESPVAKELSSIELAYSPDGTRLAMVGQTIAGAAGYAGFVFVYDLATGKRRVLPGNASALTLAFTSDSRRLIIGGYHGHLTIQPLESGAKSSALLSDDIFSAAVTNIAVAPTGRRLYVAWVDGKIDIFQLDAEIPFRLESIPPLPPRGLLASMAIAPDDRSLFAGYSDGSVVRWRRWDGEDQRWRSTELYRHATGVSQIFLVDGRLVSFDSNGRLYIARDEGVGAPAHVKFTAVSGLRRAWIDAQTQRIGLVTAGRLQWFDPRSGHVVAASAPPPGTVDGPRPESSVLARNQNRVLRQRSTDAVVEGTDQKATVLPVGKPVDAGTFSADGRTVYILAGRQVQAWDSISGRRIGGPADVGDRASRLSSSPDGRWLAVVHVATTGTRDGGAALTLLELPGLKTHIWQASHDSGHSLLPARTIFVDGSQRLYLADQVNQDSSLSVELWHLRAGKRLDDPWQADEGTIVLGTIDDQEPLWLADLSGGKLITLDLRPDQLVDWACRLAGRVINRDEWVRLIGTDRAYVPRCPPKNDAVR